MAIAPVTYDVAAKLHTPILPPNGLVLGPSAWSAYRNAVFQRPAGVRWAMVRLAGGGGGGAYGPDGETTVGPAGGGGEIRWGLFDLSSVTSVPVTFVGSGGRGMKYNQETNTYTPAQEGMAVSFGSYMTAVGGGAATQTTPGIGGTGGYGGDVAFPGNAGGVSTSIHNSDQSILLVLLGLGGVGLNSLAKAAVSTYKAVPAFAAMPYTGYGQGGGGGFLNKALGTDGLEAGAGGLPDCTVFCFG